MIVLETGEYPIVLLAFAPDGCELVVNGHSRRNWNKARFGVWDLAAGRHIWGFQPFWPGPDAAAYNPVNGWLYFCASYGGMAAVEPDRELGIHWPQTMGLYEGDSTIPGPSTAVAVRPDGTGVVAAYSEPIRLFGLDHPAGALPVRQWDLQPPPSGRKEYSHIRSMVMTPDGTRLLALAGDNSHRVNRLEVRSAATGGVLEGVSCPSRDPDQLAVSPDGRWVVVRANRSLYVFTADDLAVVKRKCTNTANRHFTGVAFHPSGKYLAATSNDETVKLFDTRTWAVAKTYTWNVGKLRSVAFSADGALAAAGGDAGKVVVWDVDV